MIALCISKEVFQLHTSIEESSSTQLVPHLIDIAEWDKTRKLLNSIEEPVHFVVNNAGCVKLSPIGQVTEEEWDMHFNLNVKAVANVTQCLAQNMIRHNIQGSIVNISSQASTTGLDGHLAYCSSKAAVDGLTRVAALELGRKGIRVNSIQPTITMTVLGKEAWKDEDKSRRILDRIPLGRFLEPSEVANVVTWLLSQEASMINGTSIPLDGGFSIA